MFSSLTSWWSGSSDVDKANEESKTSQEQSKESPSDAKSEGETAGATWAGEDFREIITSQLCLCIIFSRSTAS